MLDTLDIKTILILWKCLLTEKSIILVCEQDHIRFLVCEALLTLLFPFKWQTTYYPYLPESYFRTNLTKSPQVPIFAGVKKLDTTLNLDMSRYVICDIESSSIKTLIPIPTLDEFTEKYIISSITIIKNEWLEDFDCAFRPTKEIMDLHIDLLEKSIREIFYFTIDYLINSYEENLKENASGFLLDKDPFLRKFTNKGYKKFAKQLVETKHFQHFISEHENTNLTNTHIYKHIQQHSSKLKQNHKRGDKHRCEFIMEMPLSHQDYIYEKIKFCVAEKIEEQKSEALVEFHTKRSIDLRTSAAMITIASISTKEASFVGMLEDIKAIYRAIDYRLESKGDNETLGHVDSTNFFQFVKTSKKQRATHIKLTKQKSLFDEDSDCEQKRESPENSSDEDYAEMDLKEEEEMLSKVRNMNKKLTVVDTEIDNMQYSEVLIKKERDLEMYPDELILFMFKKQREEREKKLSRATSSFYGEDGLLAYLYTLLSNINDQEREELNFFRIVKHELKHFEKEYALTPEGDPSTSNHEGHEINTRSSLRTRNHPANSFSNELVRKQFLDKYTKNYKWLQIKLDKLSKNEAYQINLFCSSYYSIYEPQTSSRLSNLWNAGVKMQMKSLQRYFPITEMYSMLAPLTNAHLQTILSWGYQDSLPQTIVKLKSDGLALHMAPGYAIKFKEKIATISFTQIDYFNSGFFPRSPGSNALRTSTIATSKSNKSSSKSLFGSKDLLFKSKSSTTNKLGKKEEIIKEVNTKSIADFSEKNPGRVISLVLGNLYGYLKAKLGKDSKKFTDEEYFKMVNLNRESQGVQNLKRDIESLRTLNLNLLQNDQKLAFLLNLHNLLLIYHLLSLPSFEDLPQNMFAWYRFLRNSEAVNIAGHNIFLYEISHYILRAEKPSVFIDRFYFSMPNTINFKREHKLTLDKFDNLYYFGLHFPLKGFPKFTVFESKHIESQLQKNARDLIEKGIKIRRETGLIVLPRFFEWYIDELDAIDENDKVIKTLKFLKSLKCSWNEIIEEKLQKPQSVYFEFEPKYGMFPWNCGIKRLCKVI